MFPMLHALIMAGGSGTRFWPKSRARLPKQLLSLDGGPTLIERTAARLEGAVLPERIFVVTTAEQAPLVRERLPAIPPENVIAEPCGRDTAAALGLGAAAIARRAPDAVIAAMPSDHVIEPASRFRQAIEGAVELVLAREGAVATVGIVPAHPATGYGYIQRGEPLRTRGARRAFRVARFREKPDRASAESYLASGEYYWNGGIFVWRARDLLRALDRFLPETAAAVRLEGEALARAYPALAKISIDYAVLERHEDVLVVEADFAWSDVGSWSAIPPLVGEDAQRNAVVGAAHVAIDSRGVLVVGEGADVVATIGLEDVVVVKAAGALLVCKKDRVEDVKKVVAELERRGRKDVL
jgi:mannose-1-phosphate guanylyltransferase